ncbi:hypothetical protein EVAR_61968_1 [Eumeta japonica]|uniref:Uncharacterized protein n=1 Tax=Eumeta variegata TaxID=151549 RepID=A0A4C1T8R3_EUMVA|nr:hypothetical protein EVAR_61968_1 [Eumeta japonica]
MPNGLIRALALRLPAAIASVDELIKDQSFHVRGDSQDDSADNEEDSDVCSDEVDSSDDSESSLESDYE